jgi:lysozyme family protein
MADFSISYVKTLAAEGGYVLHAVSGDRGGMTYAGISRNAHPSWSGWADIDAGRTPPPTAVQAFYRTRFWDPLRGDKIKHQAIADSIYDFAVNAGLKVACSLAQTVATRVLGLPVAVDGIIGPKTLIALAQCDPDRFVAEYTLGRVAYYCGLVRRNRAQIKFIIGWVSRALRFGGWDG